MKKGLAALRWLGWAGLAVPAGRLMVTKELCNWFVIASPPSTIYTVDIYTQWISTQWISTKWISTQWIDTAKILQNFMTSQ